MNTPAPTLTPTTRVLAWCLHLLIIGLLVLAAGRALADSRADAGKIVAAAARQPRPGLRQRQDPHVADGLPIEVFDDIRQGVLTDRSQYYKDLSAPFYGANREGSTISQGTRDEFWLWSMTVGIKGAYDCIKAFSETDTTEDLKKVDVPTLIVHGDDDQIVPIVSAGDKSSKIVKGAQYKVYEGAPHGLATVPKYAEIFNRDLLEFARS
ncbi:alpha/beta fold hydrolase [Streptomyces mirabilis]|uniref:alpha/beta fold hydrolase n=1 Tax=Streptomyces mirabilis TaxID=68239 RepID=UPI0033D0ECA9